MKRGLANHQQPREEENYITIRNVNYKTSLTFLTFPETKLDYSTYPPPQHTCVPFFLVFLLNFYLHPGGLFVLSAVFSPLPMQN